jgi:hypothetical protein
LREMKMVLSDPPPQFDGLDMLLTPATSIAELSVLTRLTQLCLRNLPRYRTQELTRLTNMTWLNQLDLAPNTEELANLTLMMRNVSTHCSIDRRRKWPSCPGL